ncbi:MAG: hypothetical protein H6Q90_685 [Deltaproteobacteria bacterium]|nr:hypothetical protein [Deltaproteobacteria bacterium]
MSTTAVSYESLSAGALALKLDDNGAFAREIALAGEELFRGIGFVVRDADWDTCSLPAKAIIRRAGESATAQSGGALDHASGDLDWSVTWAITDRGVEARARATSRSGFETSRTGLVVLHALGATRGRPVKVTHSDGSVEETLFPDLVSPNQPFFDIAALEYATAAGHRLRLSFAGDVFEIEDERNWTDACYKTYCPPLGLGQPYRIGPSVIVEQTVKLEILAAAPAIAPARHARPRMEMTATLPALGTSLQPGAIGIGQPEALKALRLGFTAIEIDLSDDDWLAGARAKIAAAPGPLRLDIRESLSGAAGEAIVALAPLLAAKEIVGLSLWDADDAALTAARAAAPGLRIGGGTGASFTELNRMERWPAADYLCWTSNPTVHGFDDDTIGETIESVRDLVRTARARSPVARFQIGPMTLGFRYSPGAATPAGRAQTAPPDVRQGGMIAAAWLVGTIAGLVDPAVETLTFFEPAGPKGLLSSDGRWSPSAHVLSRLAPYAGRPVSGLRWPGVSRAAGLLIEDPDERILCFAHSRDEELPANLPPGVWSRMERLTENGFVAAPTAEFRAQPFSVWWAIGPR